MRVGHAGVALVAKRFRPAVSSWVLLGAAYGPDIIELTLRGFGYRNRELSHSLVSVGLCATIVAASYLAAHRSVGDATAIWLAYVLHWPADFITGIKPTWPGGPNIGLMLYDRPVLVWIVDLGVLAAGWFIYRTGTRERPPIGEPLRRIS